MMKTLKTRIAALLALVVFSSALVAPVATASHAAGHDSTKENVTELKDGTIETLADWIPTVVMFTLLAFAIGAIFLVVRRLNG